MNLLHRLGDAYDALRGKTEQRSMAIEGISTTLGYIPSMGPGRGAGRLISPVTAENLATVSACVGTVSTAMASLPVYVYRRVPDGREELPNHPVMRMVRNGVNSRMTFPDFMEWLVAQMLLRGNGLSGVKSDNAGQPVELEPVPWEWCAVQLLANGRLAYDVTTFNQFAGGNGRVSRWLDSEVLHFRDRTDDGVIGKSRLQRAAATIATSLYVQDFAGSLYENGVNPSGILTLEQNVGEQQREEIKTRLSKLYEGPNKAGKVLLLEGPTAKWNQLTISPEDAELLASRRFSREELASIFQVPPPLVGIWDHSSFTNSETAGRWFAKHTLLPIKTKLQAEMARALLTEEERQDTEIVFDLAGLLQGDDEARWRAHEIAVKNEILTPNEVREVEGWNRRAGGNQVTGAANAGQ